MARARHTDHNDASRPREMERADEPSTESPRSESRPLDSIARRAYERFEMRGGEHGHDQEDWFEAERELRERDSTGE
jgi:hypothetical protein